MEIEEIKYQLNLIGNNLLSQSSGIKCYLFGSILKNPKIANDIDVLILYETEANLWLVKQELKPLIRQYPLHIIYFTLSEERELNFVEQQMAEKIFSF